MASGPRLTIDVTGKTFAGVSFPLYEELHVVIEPSSVVALVGPSGVGKSTLLRMIAGIDSDFTGSILVDGVPAHAAPPPGFVFQDPRLLPWLTASENIRAVDPKATPADASAALERVGLADIGELYPHQLSGGMQRRVALARAFAVNARLLLLDEPFVSLDRVLVGEMQHLFARLVADARPTVVFVSHLTDDAARLADRAILFAGRPARIVADIAMDILPQHRDAIAVNRYRDQLDSHFTTEHVA